MLHTNILKQKIGIINRITVFAFGKDGAIKTKRNDNTCGLKGQQYNSPGQRLGNNDCQMFALKGQKQSATF